MAAVKSAAASVPTPEKSPTPERKRFALSGPSRPLDLKTHAARRDLADIRLAGRWFAPHYVEAEPWVCGPAAAAVYETPNDQAALVGELQPGDGFAVLEVSGTWSWGFCEATSRVGYVHKDGLVRN